jgi:hypothetical protein
MTVHPPLRARTSVFSGPSQTSIGSQTSPVGSALKTLACLLRDHVYENMCLFLGTTLMTRRYVILWRDDGRYAHHRRVQPQVQAFSSSYLRKKP